MKKITGLELNEGMLGQAKKKTVDLKNVELLQGSILHMPFEDAQFDGVICNQVCEHRLSILILVCDSYMPIYHMVIFHGGLIFMYSTGISEI